MAAAQTMAELQRSRRRKRLTRGLLLGVAAIGVPALANALVRRRVGRPPPPRWGRLHRYDWSEGEVVFQRLGDGPGVVLLHSFGPGHSSEQWRGAAERLADEHRVYAPDLPGWGRSDKPPVTYDAELYVRFLGDFLADVVGGRPVVVVAAGLAAAYAVALAVDDPDAVRALALVCPLGLDLHGRGPDVKDALVYQLLRLPVLGESALNLYTSRSGLARHLRSEVYAAPEKVDAEVVERHWRLSHQPGAELPLAAYLSGHLDQAVEELLPRLETPIWLAWGRRSSYPPVETADLWLRHLPSAELTVFEASGSQPHGEQPAAFRRGLEEFLSRLPG